MPRPLITNPLDERIMIRMDKRLRIQLENLAKSNKMNLSTMARNALQKFFYESLDK